MQSKSTPNTCMDCGKAVSPRATRCRPCADLHSQSTLKAEMTPPNPSGLCLCGCGMRTKRARTNDRYHGRVVGEYVKYLPGHHGRRIDGEGPNPSGLCECGCGQRTAIATRSVTRRGFVEVEGQPRRFVRGHGNTREEPEYVVQDMGYETPCHIWQRGLNDDGYGKTFRQGSYSTLAHIVVWERTHGRKPKGHVLHHLCEVKACVRDDHLKLLTRSEHTKLHEEDRRAAANLLLDLVRSLVQWPNVSIKDDSAA